MNQQHALAARIDRTAPGARYGDSIPVSRGEPYGLDVVAIGHRDHGAWPPLDGQARSICVRGLAQWQVGVGESQRVLATLKLSPLLRWVNVARPALGAVVFQPAIGLPAPARKAVKSADALPQSMLRLETV